MLATTVPNLNNLKCCLYAISICICLQTCSSNIPSGILQPPKMSKVFFKVLEYDEFVTSFALKNPNADTLMLRMSAYKTAIDSSNCTAAEFEKSLQWYQDNPNMFRVVLDSINKIVNLKRTQRYQVKTAVPEADETDSTDAAAIPDKNYTPSAIKAATLQKRFKNIVADTLAKDPLPKAAE